MLHTTLLNHKKVSKNDIHRYIFEAVSCGKPMCIIFLLKEYEEKKFLDFIYYIFVYSSFIFGHI